MSYEDEKQKALIKEINAERVKEPEPNDPEMADEDDVGMKNAIVMKNAVFGAKYILNGKPANAPPPSPGSSQPKGCQRSKRSRCEGYSR